MPFNEERFNTNKAETTVDFKLGDPIDSVDSFFPFWGVGASMLFLFTGLERFGEVASVSILES